MLSRRARENPTSYVNTVTPRYVRQLIARLPDGPDKTALVNALDKRTTEELTYFREVIQTYLRTHGPMSRKSLYYELIFACPPGSEEYAEEAIDQLLVERVIGLINDDLIMKTDF